ncbi:rho family-interacting cell polarization regulator 2-like isoform X2 [Stegodyphus dumicola]|uniref:rho family-interacting cell polarization regulator 2-like isoform X2 n=1 Tax=Stegodyphus dumicola TaxID=202533 RepID=UPI0015B10015|nr:rho family-interacting cell polarization regulator 2-like isoform X2 [Stegodyphus dumicola]
MSLNEKKRHKQLPDIYLSEGISRSKSFAGLSHRRTYSVDLTSSGGFFGPSSTLSSARHYLHGLAHLKPKKLRKAPQPEQAQIVFDIISKGLKDCIAVTQNEISSFRIAFDNVSVSSLQQVKAHERYLKSLEFHLAKLEEVKEQYDVQQRMRVGIRSMGHAFVLSPGKEKETALQSIKAEFKECTEVMCTYENHLELLMGTLQFEMKGIQGFARICSGDVFEVVLKHGDQKWKTRGRVARNGEQLWENKYVLFKSLFNEPLCIKAVEVRGLGKNILLGNKFCETRDLFSPHPQQMTINLNQSGSLKLNLVITWNSISASAEKICVPVPPSAGMPYSCDRHNISQSSIHEVENLSELSLSEKEGTQHNANFCDIGQSCSSESTSASAQSSAFTSPDVEATFKYCPCSNCDFIPCPSEENSESHSVSSSDSHASGSNLKDILKSISLILDDNLESYPEVNEFSQVLKSINRFLKGENDSTSGSSISISIESALGCFDFLNTAIESEEFENANDRISEDNNIKPCDQNSASDIHILPFNKENCRSNLDLTSFNVSSGNEQIDVVLTEHLVYCSKLISSLNASQHMKLIENYNLKKLKKQNSCLVDLLKVLKMATSVTLDDFFEESDVDVQKLWRTVAGKMLYCVSENFCAEMEKVITKKAVLDGYMASVVSHHLVCEILDSGHFDSTSRISVLHFKAFFSSSQSPDSVLLEFVADAMAAEDLKCRDVQKAFAAVSVLSKIVPSSHSLYLIGSLLIETNTELQNIAGCYLKSVCSKEDLKEKVILKYLRMLYSETPTVRLVSCVALEMLQAKHFSEQLSYVADNDNDACVREAANNALCKFEKMAVQDSV